MNTAVNTAINNNNNNSNTEFVKIMKKFIKELNVKKPNITCNLCQENGSINKDVENEDTYGICKNKYNNCNIYERYNGSLKKNIPYFNNNDKDHKNEAKKCGCKKNHNSNLCKKPKSLFI